MRCFRYLTHPQIRLDANVPVPLWGLSDLGRSRVERFKTSAVLSNTRSIVSSMETKALETAAILANQWKLPLHVKELAHENDRASTGFLTPPEFEIAADLFFAHPDKSMRGWETAIEAQRRIVLVFNGAISKTVDGDMLFVGHGGVGTLLFCSLQQEPIKRIRDQPQGGGNLFCYDLDSKKIVHGWQSMESLND
jgi:broad specificity phosphatase PhoE